jgi:hypothetical protein
MRRADLIKEIEKERAGLFGGTSSQLFRLASIAIINGVSIQDVMDENEKIADIIIKDKKCKKRKSR